MAAPVPTSDMVTARRILREAALPTSQRRLRISADAVQRMATTGITESLEVLGPVDHNHAGWALLLTGIRIARSTDTLAPPSRGRRPDTSFSVGLLWGGLVAAVGGDQLVSDAALDEAGDSSWQPGEDARRVRRLAAELADTLLDPFASPEARERFEVDSIIELDKSLVGLDHVVAGWMLCGFGLWMGSGVGGVVAPLTRRRGFGLRAVTDSRRAAQGCGFAGALVAQTGLALLGDPRAATPDDAAGGSSDD